MGNNFSKIEVTCTVTAADRKKIDSLKYHEKLHPNMIKTSSRKKAICKQLVENDIFPDDYKLRKKTGY